MDWSDLNVNIIHAAAKQENDKATKSKSCRNGSLSGGRDEAAMPCTPAHAAATAKAMAPDHDGPRFCPWIEKVPAGGFCFFRVLLELSVWRDPNSGIAMAAHSVRHPLYATRSSSFFRRGYIEKHATAGNQAASIGKLIASREMGSRGKSTDFSCTCRQHWQSLLLYEKDKLTNPSKRHQDDHNHMQDHLKSYQNDNTHMPSKMVFRLAHNRAMARAPQP